MSLPSFPNVDPPIRREDAVNQILSSIAMEELGLSHILNAEGEKMQYILGTLPGLSGPAATVEDVLNANESVRGLLETAVQNQLFLGDSSSMLGGKSVFCPQKAGTYQISYRVTLSVPSVQPVGTRLLISSADDYEGVIAPTVGARQFECTITLALPERTTIELQAYSTTPSIPGVDSVQLASGASGASMLVVRLGD